MRCRSSIVLCLVGLLIASAPAFAQRTTGDIVGTVSDDTGAVLPGVTVTLEGEGVAGTPTTVTSGKGFYRFNRLHPGFYDLTFKMDGFTALNRSGVRVSLGATTEENVTLSLGSMTDEVTVTADSVVVDTTAPGLSNTYGKEMVENAPLRRDSIFDLIQASPGVVAAADGSSSSTVMGSATDENQYQFDGVDITARTAGGSWVWPNIDIIDEVEVLSLGAPAEYGHAPGAIFNVVTKQGSNSFHGDVNFYLQTDGLTGRNTTDEQDGGNPFYRDRRHDFTAQLGGPIVKDKLWFFGSYQYQMDASTEAGIPREFVQEWFNWRIYGKINWQINPNHKIQATFHEDWYDLPDGGSPTNDPSTKITETGRSPTPGFAYTGVLSDKTMLEVRYGGFFGKDHGDPVDPDQPRVGSVYYNDVHGGLCSQGPCRSTGGIYAWYDNDVFSTAVNVSVSHYAEDFLGGSHDFKFGVQYTRAGQDNGRIGYQDWFGLYEYYYEGYGYYEYVWGYDYSPLSYSGIATGKAVFLDDTFRVNDRLTLKLGARYDQDRASASELPVLDSDGVPTGETIPAVDNLFTWTNFSPRLGFILKLTGDGKTVLRGHYGRYTRGLATAEFAGSSGITIQHAPTWVGYYDPADFYAETLDGDGRGYAITGEGTALIDPNYKSPHTNQFVLGFERELSANLGLSLTYTHKRGHNYPAWQDDGEYEEFDYVDPTTGNTIRLQALTSDPEDRVYTLTNPEGMDTRMHAFTAVLTKRMADHWELTTSLGLLRSTGMLASGAFGQSGGQVGGVAWNTFGRSPNDFVNIGGRLVGERPVTFKTQLLVELPAGFLAGANYIYTSGVPWARTASINTGRQGRETILLEERDGSRRLATRKALDVRLQKAFNLSETARLVFFVDAFNVFNNDANEGTLSRRADDPLLDVATNLIRPRRLQLGGKIVF